MSAPLLLLLIVGCSDDPELGSARFTALQGERRAYWSETSQEIRVGGVDGRPFEQRIGLGLRFDVLEPQRSGTLLKVTFDSAVVVMRSGGVDLHYDSGDSDIVVPLAARPFAAVVGGSVLLHRGEDGSVVVEGGEELRGRAMEEMYEPNPQTRTDAGWSLQSMLADEALVRMLESYTGILPENRLETGERWKRRTTEAGLVAAEVETWYGVTSVEQGIARLEMEADVAGEQQRDSLRRVGWKIDGERRGTLEVDVASGWLLSSSVTGELAARAQRDTGEAVPLHVRSTTTIRRRTTPSAVEQTSP